jgi:uncharacterized protein YdeI (YjbR/CyaY-like superfamily)
MAAPPNPKPEPKLLDVDTAGDWEAWLDANAAATTEGVWLRLRTKKGATPESLTYTQAVEVALCFGWIDGQARKHDDVSRVQRFTPRRKRSVWSRINTERAVRLIDEGRMRPGGQAEVDRARDDGRWDAAYEPPSTATIPDDFLAELEKHPKAKAFFATLNKRNTFPVTYRLSTAKKPETRAKRLAEMIAMFDRGEKFYD